MDDPVIAIMKQMKCPRCATKTVYCDCWVEDYIQPERLSEKNHFVDVNKMVSDSLNSMET